MTSVDFMIRLLTDATGAEKGLKKFGDDVEKETKRGGDKFKGMAAVAGGALAAIGISKIIGAVGDFASETIESLARIETINTQTEAVIASTGGAANVTAEHVENLAGKLEGLTATEAESIQEGSNLLLTFKNIKNGVGEGNDIFDQATTSLVDMSRAMGTDPQSAAIQLGKALNDPIAGISALSRVGIQFTDDQKALIQSMVDAGDVAGAQKIILGELNSQFGGSGAAYAETYAGKMDLLEHAMGTMGEQIMSTLMPALSTFADVGLGVFKWFEENPVITTIILAVAAALLALAAAMWVASLTPITLIIMAIIIGVGLLVAAVIWLVTNWESVWAAISQFFIDVWTNIVNWFTGLWGGFVGWFQGILNGIATWWQGLWSGIGSFFAGIWNGIIGVVRGAANWITSTISNIGRTVSSIWTGFTTGLRNVWEGLWNGLGGIVRRVWNGILGVIEGGVNGAINLINAFTGGIRDVAGSVFGVSIGAIPHVRIPRLAKGGVTTGPTLALVGDNPGGRELVEPVDGVAERLERVALAAASRSSQQPSGPMRIAREDLDYMADRVGNTIYPLIMKGAQKTVASALGG